MEQVLVVDRVALFGGHWPQGFVPIAPDDAARWLGQLEHLARFEPRDRAEAEPAWKQLIPYCAVRHGEEVFCVERLPAQGEARLHGRLSIGVGGHVNPIDGPVDGILGRAATRELHEELVFPDGVVPRLVGLINDDATQVGSVHAGLAYVVDLPAGRTHRVAVREISKMQGGFRGLVGPSSLWQDAARLESWSALLLDAFLRPMGGSRGSSSEGSHPSIPPEDAHHGGAQDAQTIP